jgi:Uma2 family endonuclease
MTVGTLMTADELLALPDDGWRYELVRGELKKMSPTSYEHGRILMRIAASLEAYASERGLGGVSGSDTGFRIARNPDTVRAPDVAFVRAERDVEMPGFFEGAPDAAFEVVSPSDRYTEVEEKTLEWLRAGCGVVIVVDPRTKSVRIHRADGAVSAADAIEIEDVVPGWKLPLGNVFR